MVRWVLVAPCFPGRGRPRLLPEVREALQLVLLLGVHDGGGDGDGLRSIYRVTAVVGVVIVVVVQWVSQVLLL